MRAAHAWLALQAVTSREVAKFVRQGGRLASALVRPLLWLVVFAAGFQNVFGVSIIPPYDTYIPYQTYIVPGLLGMVLLFNGMQSSLAMVCDREMGVMRLLLTAPLPRWYLLFCKLLAGTLLSVLQAYVFLIIAALFEVEAVHSLAVRAAGAGAVGDDAGRARAVAAGQCAPARELRRHDEFRHLPDVPSSRPRSIRCGSWRNPARA